jgi:hypothetical protein
MAVFLNQLPPVAFAQQSGGPAVLTFADDFHRVDQPFGLGDQWMEVVSMVNSTCLGPNIPGAINVAGNQASFSICSSNGNNWIACVPIPLTWNIVNASGRQFAQCRMTANNSGAGNFSFNGPFVFGNLNKGSFYQINDNGQVGPTAGVFQSVAVKGGVQTALSAQIAYAIGDTLRIEAIAGTLGTTVNIYKNGVQVSSNLDNAAGFLTSGLCGYMDLFVSAGITTSIDNFSCGVF